MRPSDVPPAAPSAAPSADRSSDGGRRRGERRAEQDPARPDERQDDGRRVAGADAPAAGRKPDRRIAAAAAPAAPRKPILVAENAGLEVETLGKTFKKRPVLRDVSLSVQRGEAVGLLGPNGAGKTTCFYIITGLIPADYGAIRLDGRDITDLPMYRRSRLGIGYLPQEASIFRGLTVEQNILAVLELIEKDRARREAALEGLMAEFSITHLRRTPAIALSGGERRRLEIARALASQPHFVLLDEPLAGIDPIAVRDIRELVSHLKDRGIGVLITDHNVRETLDIVDRAYILHNGTVLMEGAPDEIVANQEVRRVYLGDRFSL
ncbi:MAG: LPS export ABC transporter ATP-binding protein [Alphaproteobacteria bacterium]|nr:LPS export ABC transporter ATP-binding protein [Alphaproteobacteria bacterium]